MAEPGETALALHEALEARARALESYGAALRAEQAVLLADALAPGAACPVCGAGEHPTPATIGADVDAARMELAAADSRVEALRLRLARATRR